MGRKAGIPAYGNKSVQGSYFISRTAAMKLRAAVKRTGKSASDVIEHGIMAVADQVTRETPRFGVDGYKGATSATSE